MAAIGNAVPPVLILAFNRLDTLQQLLPRVRAAKPARVYIACDGPRHAEERIKTDAVRHYLLQAVDWTDDIKTLYRDDNLGCGRAVAKAITWFFTQEEMGIILEDDCVPHIDFFDFCARNLEKFRHDSRISMIGGMNYLRTLSGDYPHEGFFSQYYPIWGWASWARAWAQCDASMPGWPDLRRRKVLRQMLHDRVKWRLFTRLFDMMQTGRIDTWDIPWVYSQIMNGSLALIPAVNMISNIGVVGTHSDAVSPFQLWNAQANDRPRSLPPHIMPQHDIDEKIFKLIAKHQ